MLVDVFRSDCVDDVYEDVFNINPVEDVFNINPVEDVFNSSRNKDIFSLIVRRVL